MLAQVCECTFVQIHCQSLSTRFVLSEFRDPHAQYKNPSILSSGRSFVRFLGCIQSYGLCFFVMVLCAWCCFVLWIWLVLFNAEQKRKAAATAAFCASGHPPPVTYHCHTHEVTLLILILSRHLTETPFVSSPSGEIVPILPGSGYTSALLWTLQTQLITTPSVERRLIYSGWWSHLCLSSLYVVGSIREEGPVLVWFCWTYRKIWNVSTWWPIDDQLLC